MHTAVDTPLPTSRGAFTPGLPAFTPEAPASPDTSLDEFTPEAPAFTAEAPASVKGDASKGTSQDTPLLGAASVSGAGREGGMYPLETSNPVQG